MCLLIVNYDGLLPPDVFKHAWTANPDGFGMAYVQRSTIKLYKNLKDWQSAYTAYATIRSKQTGAMLLHFRYGTHGLIDLPNCHPFRVSDRLVFAHNGIIEIDSENPTQSDTAAFCEVLKGLPDGFLNNPAIRQLISLSIGSSKLAFLDTHGHVTIIHEELGHYQGKNWFSNASYRPIPPVSQRLSWRYTPSRRIIRDGLLEPCGLCGQSYCEADMTENEEGEYLCDGCAEQIGLTWKPSHNREGTTL